MNAFHRVVSRLSERGSLISFTVKNQEAKAQCPAHDDRVQSLSLSIGKNNDRAVLHCFAGCETEAIVEKLGMTMADLYDDKATAQAGTAVEIYYDYKDEDGVLLNQVVRMVPKGFRQRRPDGNGGWAWNLEGVRRVMYRLPEIQGKRAILLVEGEKDADRLWSLRPKIPATTTLGGSSAWRPEFRDQLLEAGVRRLGILPDNDAPGLKYAYAVAKDCHEVGIHVSIIQLPGLGLKEDVSDFLDRAAHPRGDLIRAIQAFQQHPTAPLSDDADLAAALEGVPLYAGEEAPKPRRRGGLVVRSMKGVDARPTNWLWEDRIPRGELSLIVGDPSAGKTFVTQAIATAAADGKDWPMGLGRAKEGAVVYVTVEDNPETSMKPRMLAMGLRNEENILLVEGFKAEDGRQHTVSIIDNLQEIEELCAESKAVMLVISPINSYLNTNKKKAMNGYKDEDVREVLTPLVQLAQRLDLAVIGVMHMNKSEQTSIMYRIGGSIAFAAVPRVVYCVLRDNEDRNKRYFGSLKTNDMMDPATLEFHIQSAPGVKSGHVVWDGESDKTIYQIMAESQQKKGKAKQDKMARAIACAEWLQFFLSDGVKTAIQVEQAGWGDGFKYTKKELDKAAARIGVEKSHADSTAPWIWKLKA